MNKANLIQDVPKMYWRRMENFSTNAVAMVLGIMNNLYT